MLTGAVAVPVIELLVALAVPKAFVAVTSQVIA